MKIDRLDKLTLAGLALIALGSWLAGYPVVVAIVGLALAAWGIVPQIGDRNK